VIFPRRLAVLTNALPAPVAAVIFAVQYKQGQREMASAVLFSNVLSIATLGALIAFVIWSFTWPVAGSWAAGSVGRAWCSGRVRQVGQLAGHCPERSQVTVVGPGPGHAGQFRRARRCCHGDAGRLRAGGPDRRRGRPAATRLGAVGWRAMRAAQGSLNQIRHELLGDGGVVPMPGWNDSAGQLLPS